MSAALMASGYSDPFSRAESITPRDKKPKTKEQLEEYMRTHRTVDSRQLREFSIKGQKVMAYSKKDAIIRLKYQKRNQRKEETE